MRSSGVVGSMIMRRWRRGIRSDARGSWLLFSLVVTGEIEIEDGVLWASIEGGLEG